MTTLRASLMAVVAAGLQNARHYVAARPDNEVMEC
jgi:hypothetical protein